MTFLQPHTSTLQIPINATIFSYGGWPKSTECPGVHVAEESLHLNVSRVLRAFNTSKKVDKDGKVMEPNGAMISGWIAIPQPFESDIKIRSEEKKDLITKIWEETKKGLESR